MAKRPRKFRFKVFLGYFIGLFFIIAFGSFIGWVNHFFGKTAWIIISAALAFLLAYIIASEPDDGKRYYGED